MPTNGTNKKIPASKIIKGFLKLPEAKRCELLNKNLSDQAKYQLGELAFATNLGKIKKESPETIRKYLTDNKNFGGPWENLIPLGEEIAGEHLKRIYSDFRAESNADKLYALVMCPDLANRLRVFWEGVKGKKREEFIRKEMLDIDSPQKAERFLSDPRNFAPGKNFQTFAEDVMKAADFSSEKSIMGHLNDGAPKDDPQRGRKLVKAAQLCMVTPGSKLDPEKIAEDLRSPDWEKKLDTEGAVKNALTKVEFTSDMVGHIKDALETIPETDEEKKIFEEAALRTCRDIKRNLSAKDLNEPSGKALVDFAEELQNGIVSRGLKEKPVKDIQNSIDAEIKILEKEKSGWFLSKTNSPEYNSMMKDMRLFKAKLDIINGKEPLNLTDEELKTVRETDASTLFRNAKRGCYNYGCLKTKQGTGGIIHDAGEDRFNSSMKCLSELNKLGKKLGLGDPAETVRDEAQREVLQHRRDKNWMTSNVEDLAAKTIYAQTLINKGVPAQTQEKLLSGDAQNKDVERIKADPYFKAMIKNMGPSGVADAMIKGVGALAVAYKNTAAAVKAKGNIVDPHELAPADIQPMEGSAVLTVPTKK